MEALLAASRGKTAQDAQFAGGLARLLQGTFERIQRIGFDVQIELILERLAMNGAALDFEEVYAVLGKGLQRGEEGAGLVSEPHGQADFCGVGFTKTLGLIGREQQDEAREVFAVVLNALAEDDGTVMFPGPAPGDGGRSGRCDRLASYSSGVGAPTRISLGTPFAPKRVLALPA